MKLKQIFQRVKPSYAVGKTGLIQVHSEERFDRIIRRERQRARETGIPFTLVTIGTLSGGMRNPRNHELIDCLIARTRLTDDIGWMDNQQRLGVMLFHATVKDARRYLKLLGELRVFQKDAFDARIYRFSDTQTPSAEIGRIPGFLKSMGQVTLGSATTYPEKERAPETGELMPIRGC